MDKKYDGHAWNMVTTNIKNHLGFSFKMVHCFSHLECV
jgi:hypothetical protein